MEALYPGWMNPWNDPFPLGDLTLRHGRIGRLDAIYMQCPDGRGGLRHWYLGAGDDGVALARPTTEGPLVPGRPEANPLDMEAHLARVSLAPATPSDIVGAFEETEWKDTGLDESLRWLEDRGVPRPRPSPRNLHDYEAAAMVRGAIVPVARRMAGHLALWKAYALQVHQHPRIEMDGGTNEAALARVLTLRKAEIEAIASMGQLPLLKPAIDLLDVRFDRPKAEFLREVMSRLGVPRAAIARIPAGLEPDGSHVRALRGFPLDWIPAQDDSKGWEAMRWIARLLGEMGAPDADFPSLVASCKGDWVSFVHRCGRAATGNDAMQDYRALSLAIMNAGDVRAEFDNFLADLLANVEGMEGRIADVAHRAMTDGRALPAVLESSRLWHERFRQPAAREMAWPPLLPTWVDRATGIKIVPLSCSSELEAEGELLLHCVGGQSFALDCLGNRSRILSLRKDGEPLSTAQVVLGKYVDAEYRVEQHLGRRNSDPTPEAAAALGAYLALPKVTQAMMLATPVHAEVPARSTEELERLLAAWRPYLAGRWRQAALEDFMEALQPEGEAPSPGTP